MEKEIALQFLPTMAFSSMAISVLLAALAIHLSRTARKKARMRGNFAFGESSFAAVFSAACLIITSLLSTAAFLLFDNGVLPDIVILTIFTLATMSIISMMASMLYYVLPILRRY